MRERTEQAMLFPNLADLVWDRHEPKEFRDLEFEIKPGFHPSTLKNSESVDSKYTYQTVELEGNQYLLAGRNDIIKTKYDILRSLNIYLGKSRSYIEHTIELSESEDTIIAESSVVRHDVERILPRGIGRSCFKTTVEYLEQLAKSRNKRVMHRVDRSPGYDGVDLSEQEWDRMFLPLLNQYGYMEVCPGFFSKLIEPN